MKYSKKLLSLFFAVLLLMSCSLPSYAMTIDRNNSIQPMTMIVTETFTSERRVSGGGGTVDLLISVTITYDAQRDKIISVSNPTVQETGISLLSEWNTFTVSASKDDYKNVYVYVEGELKVTYLNIFGQTTTYTQYTEFTEDFVV